MRLKAMLIALALVALSFSTVQASGIPALGLMNDPDAPVVVVMKFGTGFTPQDAANSSLLISQALGLAGGFTTVTSSVQFFTPANLAQMGLADADVVKAAIKTPAAQLGYTYIFLDISKTASAGGTQYGQNHKVNVWIANDSTMAQFAAMLNVTGDFLYIATVEYPEKYPQLLSQMLSSL